MLIKLDRQKGYDSRWGTGILLLSNWYYAYLSSLLARVLCNREFRKIEISFWRQAILFEAFRDSPQLLKYLKVGRDCFFHVPSDLQYILALDIEESISRWFN
jgi:hypothetical protein